MAQPTRIADGALPYAMCTCSGSAVALSEAVAGGRSVTSPTTKGMQFISAMVDELSLLFRYDDN